MLFVSALIGHSYPRQIIFNLVLEKKVQVCISPQIFSEYIEVLSRPKFLSYPEFIIKAEIVLNKIDELSLKVNPLLTLDVIKDENDNRFLELAITAKADFLITGNRSDFRLGHYEQTQIVTPKEYIELNFE